MLRRPDRPCQLLDSLNRTASSVASITLSGLKCIERLKTLLQLAVHNLVAAAHQLRGVTQARGRPQTLGRHTPGVVYTRTLEYTQQFLLTVNLLKGLATNLGPFGTRGNQRGKPSAVLLQTAQGNRILDRSGIKTLRKPRGDRIKERYILSALMQQRTQSVGIFETPHSRISDLAGQILPSKCLELIFEGRVLRIEFMDIGEPNSWIGMLMVGGLQEILHAVFGVTSRAADTARQYTNDIAVSSDTFTSILSTPISGIGARGSA